jgi:hypothetical protein
MHGHMTVKHGECYFFFMSQNLQITGRKTLCRKISKLLVANLFAHAPPVASKKQQRILAALLT